MTFSVAALWDRHPSPPPKTTTQDHHPSPPLKTTTQALSSRVFEGSAFSDSLGGDGFSRRVRAPKNKIVIPTAERTEGPALSEGSLFAFLFFAKRFLS